MSKQKEIKKRINSIANTQQITKAMKMVAAAKLRRAQDNLLNGRPYAFHLLQTIRRLAALSDLDESDHPLLRSPKGTKTLLLVLTSDRGLCGAFNVNIIRRAEQFIRDNQNSLDRLSLAFIGKKAYEYFKKRYKDISYYFEGIYESLSIENIHDQVIPKLIDDFTSEKIDQIYILYNEFKSVISQRIVIEQLLPLSIFSGSDLAEEGLAEAYTPSRQENLEYIYEPEPRKLLNHILPLHLSVQLYHSLQESFAAEMGARMSAMENATKNASELIDKLTLAFNRARQAAITTEIIEVINGAQAL